MARAAHCKVHERDHFGFGWGRRICPGIHLVSTGLTKGTSLIFIFFVNVG
jgi:cytochrome P450